MQNYFKWLLCGGLCSFCMNIIDVFLIFQNYDSAWQYVYFPFVSVIVCLIIVFAVKPKKIAEYFVSLLLVILGVFIVEGWLYIFDVYNWFYFIAHPNSYEISLGESLLTAVLYISEGVGLFFGFCIVLIKM